MVRVSAGAFQMGSPPAETGRDDDEVQHPVQITRGFWLGEAEVTQGLWQDVMGSNPADTGKVVTGATLPVENVSWYDAVAFANALSRLEGLEECYQIAGREVRWPKGLDCAGYRLPTEAEWEYAARAGTEDRYAGTGDEDAVCHYGNVNNPKTQEKYDWPYPPFPCEDGYSDLAPVRSFQPNGWGLYDMMGNVWEWVWDWYQEDYQSDTSTDPTGPDGEKNRVYRSGNWFWYANGARVAERGRSGPSAHFYALGLRLARSSP